MDYETTIIVQDITLSALDDLIQSIQEYGTAEFRFKDKTVHAVFEVGDSEIASAPDLWDLRDIFIEIEANHEVELGKPTPVRSVHV